MKQQKLVTEKSPTWLNIHDDLRFTEDGQKLIWSSERSGFKHLYLYSLSGKKVRQLTRGNWHVDKLEHIDDENQVAYFTGRRDTPLEKHLYSVSLQGGKIERVSKRNGYHSIAFSKDGRSYIDEFSTANTPPQLSLHNNEGKRIAWLSENRLDNSHPLTPYLNNWIQPTFSSFTTKDNTKLYYRLHKPRDFDDSKKYPALVYLYGGPGVQRVVNKWSRLFPQYIIVSHAVVDK